MDVDKIAFPSRLLLILEALSECHFVSLDFEFSGVSSKPISRQKQSIQERYAETKESAEKYQILQIGLTCAIQDMAKEAYILKPFNIPLSPVFDEDLDIERQFCFQSGAVEFLLRNSFNFNISFEDGVPYLSRDEEEVAKAKFKARSDKGRFEDIEIVDSDTLTLVFLKKVRGEIWEWLERGKGDSVEIMSRTVHWREMERLEKSGDLTAFDKRLIHQIVRNEFPELVTISRRQSILIKKTDKERELQVQKDKYKRLKKKIYLQTGFRWIIEAMTSGSLSHVDLTWFAKDPDTGTQRYYDTIAFEARYNRVVDELRRKRPVLVGHNCFTDLIYLYSTFIGKCPNTVSEFQLCIHDLFPTVVDTKYMFTHNCGTLNPMSSLDSIDEALRVQNIPRIQTHEDHRKYEKDEMYHEAGYDSYLTARVMILLSAKLETAGTHVIGEAKTPLPMTPSGEHDLGGLSLPSMPFKDEGSNSLVEALLKSAQANEAPPPTLVKDSSKKSQQPQTQTVSRFATKTLFEALASSSPPKKDDEDQSTRNGVVGSRFALDPTARSFPISATGDDAADTTETKGKGRSKDKEPKLDSLMPPFTSDFWKVYANKLRVFGTVESMLDLDPMRIQ